MKHKTLVVFYSRHNHTQLVGELIAKRLGATLEEIKDSKDRSHLKSWAKSAFDEELKTPTKIQHPTNDPKDFDLVIIGTPIWDGISPPAKAYLKHMKKRFKKVAFFITFSAAAEDAAYQMEKLTGKKPLAILEVQDKQIARGEHKKLIKEFCSEIKKKL